MPRYDYRCESCDAVFEVTRPMSASKSAECPRCGSAAKRVFTPVGVAFKGSGFYSTDYASQPAPPSSCPASSGSTPCAGCSAAE